MSSGKEAESYGAPPPAYGEPSAPPVNNQQAPQGYNTSYPPQQGYAPQYPPQQQAGYGYNHGYPNTGQHTVVLGGQPSVVLASVQPMTGDVKDHCTWSVITTIFCCFWLGVFAIMKSQGVRDALMRGDRMGAQRLSAEALRLNRVGLGLGITFNIIYIIFFGVYFGVYYRYISYINYCYDNWGNRYIC